MTSTQVSIHLHAPRAAVYRALVDERAIAAWRVPPGMTGEIHTFDPQEGGAFRISLTYDAPTARGKTTARTDTYHGHFVTLVQNERVIEVLEFETDDPEMRGEMSITYRLEEANGGTNLHVVHDGLPPGLPPAANEAGWRESLAKLAALVEADDTRPLRQ